MRRNLWDYLVEVKSQWGKWVVQSIKTDLVASSQPDRSAPEFQFWLSPTINGLQTHVHVCPHVHVWWKNNLNFFTVDFWHWKLDNRNTMKMKYFRLFPWIAFKIIITMNMNSLTSFTEYFSCLYLSTAGDHSSTI